MNRPAGALLGFLALFGAGCEPAPPKPASALSGRHPISGTVVAQRDARSVTLAHNAVKDFMPAMVMDFTGESLPALRAGDRIRATLVVTSEATRLTDVSVVTAGIGSGMAAPLVAAPPGALVPDVVLTNQFDKPIRLTGFRGRVLVVTFIYTRCPLPDFCPRLMRNFQDLRRALEARSELLAKVHLLSVTIDPEFDTPEVLRAYGEARLGRRGAFDRLDLATGRPADIAALATFFGLRYEAAAGQISHTLITAIVGTDGRLVRRFPEMTWNLGEALTIVEREAARADPF